MNCCNNKVCIKQLDTYIMPATPIDPTCVDLASCLIYQIGQFTRKLGLVHAYRQRAVKYYGVVVPWRTVYEAKYGTKLHLCEEELFRLYNFVTTNASKFGQLIRLINKLSQDKWDARYIYDSGHSISMMNAPYNKRCFKYLHQFPTQIRTACLGQSKCTCDLSKTCEPCTTCVPPIVPPC